MQESNEFVWELTKEYTNLGGRFVVKVPRNGDGLTEKGVKLLDFMLTYIATLEARSTMVRPHEMIGQNVYARAHEVFPYTFAKPEPQVKLSDSQKRILRTAELSARQRERYVYAEKVREHFPEVFEDEADWKKG